METKKYILGMRMKGKRLEYKKKNKNKKEWQQQLRYRSRLAICVVFYDNYKYGHKALCLEQVRRLSLSEDILLNIILDTFIKENFLSKIHFLSIVCS